MIIESNLDIFAMGQEALAAARAATGGQAFFTASRHLQADGSWLGPSSAGLALVTEGALAALGGLDGAQRAGANAVLCRLDGTAVEEALARGLRVLVRVPFVADESAQDRALRLSALRVLIEKWPGIDGIVPSPEGEAQGLDTIQFFAACRLACPCTHVLVNLDLLGHKLGQLCLSFGADEIMGTIMKQRELRLGARASSNEITRDEAALLLRASGFVPCERLADGKVQVL
jgi:hypothetical protein